MTVLKIFTTIMKITLLPSFFKAGALAALACGTLALTSISLSSCGGGADTDDSLDAQFARAIVGHRLAFDGRSTLLTIRPNTYTRGTGRCVGSATWGNDYNCVITLSNTSKQGGRWQGQLSLTFIGQNDPSNDTSFRSFYGIPTTGLDGLSVTPMAFDINIPEDFRRNPQGDYTAQAAQYAYAKDGDAKSGDIVPPTGKITIDPGT